MLDRDENGRFAKGNKIAKGRPKNINYVKEAVRNFYGKKIKEVDPALIAQIVGTGSKEFAEKYGNMTFADAIAIAFLKKGLLGDWEFLKFFEPESEMTKDGVALVVNLRKMDIEDD